MTTADRAASIDAAASAVRSRLEDRIPSIAVVLGSGLGGVADRVTGAVRIPYQEIPGFHAPGVPGHKGELVVGALGGKQVIAQSGRFHMYEGYSADESALPVRVFANLGVRLVILTNAAGGIRRTFQPGTVMLIRDHLNLTGRSPLSGAVLPGEERFPDMSAAYDPDLRELAFKVAQEQGIALEQGVYAALLGPTYETPAEVDWLETCGADAVGMSTVVEVIAARARGLACLGFSTVTNLAAGRSTGTLSHAEVMDVAAQVGDRVARLIEGVVAATP